MRTISLISVACVLISTSAVAQTDADGIAQMRRGYDDCVMNSAAAQLKQGGPDSDLNMVMELGFQACGTEERAIRLMMASHNVGGVNLEAIMIKIKLDLKKQLRDIVANPRKYLGR